MSYVPVDIPVYTHLLVCPISVCAHLFVCPMFQLIRKRTAAIERVKTYLAETIDEHKETFDNADIRDFIDLYIKASREDTGKDLFTGKYVCDLLQVTATQVYTMK